MEIRIVKDRKKQIVKDKDIIEIKSKSKKDFYKQIDKMVEEKSISRNWGLWGINKYKKWFS